MKIRFAQPGLHRVGDRLVETAPDEIVEVLPDEEEDFLERHAKPGKYTVVQDEPAPAPAEAPAPAPEPTSDATPEPEATPVLSTDKLSKRRGG